MNKVGQIERATQNRIVKLFREQLDYKYYGNLEERQGNSNIEVDYLTKYLKRKGYSDAHISKALDQLRIAANNQNEPLYTNNKNVYGLLRYGVKVKVDVGDKYDTVHLIDWKKPLNNEFAIAEEATVMGNHEKRPDIVIYINGIALGVLELKRSIVSIGEGIRQSIVNQQKGFIEKFFSTIQLIFAGNDTEGLRYGTVGTKEKYFLKWKEDENDDEDLLLDKYIKKMCSKERFLELIYDFVIFDAEIKKLPRHHQYFGIKAAQEFYRRKEGGIIWHTQGSGKSIVMVLLSKWILENNPNARIVIITDRDELDKQIERVFNDTEIKVERAKSGRDLMEKLSRPLPRMICSLVHKFGRKEVDDFEEYIKELEESPTQTFGEIFVFVDECHRTQSGKLHKVMKATLKNSTFIGFTGTPLLKKDKQTSLEVFGKYIHTYKFNEAVEDEVVLDLVYEARDVDQRIASPQKIDAWFEAKTRGLNDFQKSELKRKWATMRNVLSSASRLDVIVNDIILDFGTKQRLNSEHGNAILVAGSIYEACRYYELFQKTELKNKCAVITSYNPSTKDIVTEGTGENTDTEKEYIYNTYINLLNGNQTEKYEDESKDKFIKEPSNMKLLIVVDKLLTGFDAPACTYLYIDKSMQDHGLFQAICRVNRLDGESKQFGYIVDYKDLFKKVENAVAVYTSELDYDNFDQKDVDVLLKDRLAKGKERLDNAIEELDALCEPVAPPKESKDYIRFFCGNPEIADDLKSTEVRRMTLYKMTVALIRAYANIADELEAAGYSKADIKQIENTLDFYLKLRQEIKNASGEVLDTKAYEADMRFLIDNYIKADDSRKLSDFGDQTLLDIIVKSGIADAVNSLPGGIKGNRQAVAETIENNVRQKIIKDYLIDPAYFEEISKVLAEIIKLRKSEALSYEEYLKKIAELAKRANDRKTDDLPDKIKTNAQIALYNNLNKDEELAVKVDEAIKSAKKADFRGNPQKENEIKRAIYQVVHDERETERIFKVAEKQSEY